MPARRQPENIDESVGSRARLRSRPERRPRPRRAQRRGRGARRRRQGGKDSRGGQVARGGRRPGRGCERGHRGAGADRHPHPCLPQGDLAQRRPGLHRPALGHDDAGGRRQRRGRQLRRLPRLCDGALALPDPCVPQRLVPGHLRLRQGRVDRRGDAARNAAGGPLRRQDRGQPRPYRRREGADRRAGDRRTGTRGAGTGAGGRQCGWPAADDPYRHGAAELCRCRLDAAAGRHPHPLLPARPEFGAGTRRQASCPRCSRRANAACCSTSPTAWAPSATRPPRPRWGTASRPTSSRRTCM